LNRQLKTIKNDVTRLNNKCDIIAKENDSLKGLVNCQNSRIDDLEAYLRSIRCDNLIITNPEQIQNNPQLSEQPVQPHWMTERH